MIARRAWRGWLGVGVIALAGGSGVARADEAYDTCSGAAAGNLELVDCGAAWVAREDAKLNVAWKALFDALAPGPGKGEEDSRSRTRADLLVEQRAWIAFKETACDFWANGDFGRDGQVVHWFTCQARLIATRTAELEQVREFVQQ